MWFENLTEMNPEKLDKLPRMPTAKVNETMFEAFNVSKVESQKAEEMQKDLETKVKVDSSELKGMEKMIGLKATDIKKMKSSG